MDLPQARSKTPFKEKAFNDSVLLKIKLLREADPNHFPTPHDGLVYNDFPLLLHIIVETCLESHEFSEKESQTHISHHFNLCSELNRVYKDRSFADILYNAEMPVEIVRFAQDNLLGGLQPSNSHDSFSSTFETPYLGDNHKLLVKTLNRELELFDQPATQRPYNLSMAVIQSSGMGKSRMLMEVGNEVFTIGITIREELPAHKTAYPPADVPFREYFEVCQGKSDEEQQADYAVLLRVLCDRFAGLIEDDFPGQTGRVLAQNVAEYLKEGSTDKAVGPNRRQLFEHVVTTATALREGKNKDSTLADLVVLLKESCQNLANLVHPHRLVNTVACIVYFDEAHALTKVVSPSQPPNQETPPPETPMPGNTPKRTAYHNLGKVLSFLVEVPMFFIFLSTNSHLHDFAPAPAHFPSTLASDGSSLITPFTGLPFDVFETKVLKSLKPRSFTLSKLCTTEVMVGFGRPLWHTLHENDPKNRIFNVAMDKLTCEGVPEHEVDSLLAALGVRAGIMFDITTHAGRKLDSKLVESHMRVVYSIPQHREYMHTGSPSEPILAEAAAQYLNLVALPDGRKGIACLAPGILANACSGGFIARGERGELVARLLVTMAHDIAAEKHYKATPKLSRDAFNQPRYHCPIPLLDFLRALLHEDYHAQVLQAMPICQSDTKKSKSITLETAFAEAYVSFSHFSLAADSVMLSNPCLATALARGMAIQAVDGQRSIDAVIPVHIGSLNAQVSTKRTSAINIQVKNRKDVRDCPVDRSITIPDVSKPVISIIFELGCSRPGVRVNHRPHASDGDPRVDYHHYEIVIYGHSSTVLGVIPPGEEPTYRSILGAARAQDDLPRRNDGLGSIEAFYALKPAFSGRRQLERYAGLIDGVEAPMEEPKEKTSKASKGEGSKGKGQPEASKAPEDKEPRPKRQTRASGASKEEDQTGKRQTRASGAPKEEEPTKKRQTRASGAPKEEQTGKRQAKASGAPKEEEPAKKRQPRAQKSQPSPPKKKQKK